MPLYDGISEKPVLCPACGCPYLYEREVNTFIERAKKEGDLLVKSKLGVALICNECDTQAAYFEEKGSELIPMDENHFRRNVS